MLNQSWSFFFSKHTNGISLAGNLWPLPCALPGRGWFWLLSSPFLQLEAEPFLLLRSPPSLVSSLHPSSDATCFCPRPFCWLSFGHSPSFLCLPHTVSCSNAHSNVFFMFQFATNKWLELFPSPPLPSHISSHVLLERRETQDLWWLRRHSTFWAGKLLCQSSEGPVSSKGFQLEGVRAWGQNQKEARASL